MTDNLLKKKYESLKDHLKSYGSIAVAFSSGVDSTFLLYAAKEALGPKKVVALTATSHFFPGRESKEAIDFCKEIGVRQILVPVDETTIDGFAQNPPNRCYLCKKVLFQNFLAVTKKEGFCELVEGSNLDDLGDYRPGLMAIAELKVKSPLRELAFTKAEIRSLSGEFGLPTAVKPSFACLASRFPYGEEITAEKLSMIDKAEEVLLSLGFSQFRVRIHGKVARIELLPADFPRFMEDSTRSYVYDSFQAIGFSYVSLDLKGYRTGSMNETLKKE